MRESELGTTTSSPKDQFFECLNSGKLVISSTSFENNGICSDHSYSKLKGPGSTLVIAEKL